MFKKKQKNTIWGSGPKLLSSTLIYFAIVLYISKMHFQIAVISEELWIIHFVSKALITIGVVLWIIIVHRIFAIYKLGILYREGLYAFCRHPLYANFILILVPGICLQFNSWITLTTPVFMYFTFKYCIKKEEQGLIEQFGEECLLQHAGRTVCLFSARACLIQEYRRRGRL